MSSADIQLLLTAIGGVIFLVALIVSKLRFHPLLALMITSIAVGLITGVRGEKVVKSIETGAGNTLGAVGIVVALGAMLGKILADSGITNSIAEIIINRTSTKYLPWAMAGAAFVIGIPMFFEVGLVILLPLIFSVARKLDGSKSIVGSPYVYIGVPVIAALAAMHGMVPPHPGPLTAIAALHTNVGATMLYGFIAAIAAIVLGGPVYGAFITSKLKVHPDEALIDQFAATAAGQTTSHDDPPSIGISLLTALLPAILMLLHAVAELIFPKGSTLEVITGFVGDPAIAMLIGVLFATGVLIFARGGDTEKLRNAMSASVKAIANVLLIIAGGGAFQRVLTDAKVGDAIMHLSQQFSLSPLVLGWIISMLLSVSTGSATVGIVGASGLLAPLAGAGNLNVPLLALSIGCGSLFFNYANHAGFWLVKESFGMSMSEATWTISVIQSIVSVVGLLMVLLMNFAPALS
ncbi:MULTISPECIES: gluconate:H+ symporter [unclassified Rhizobium]|uniref:GntP family permease n=1 Tax=unclassified Rhizobium TaxID=2613769 RepID=UPI0016133959|nr:MULTISPECIES: gluconate:H+ symporter [unclassified Rhizobium]MBB3289650.1 GntP family gluconate:H+ symporter [Rhizobium sp. BK252]MBB3404593.1 GntP family gluconate:H+ symporter [Rhizobium sp. BK289]MBB3417035.1 GntP family gluconate:H+ symporter [Rhizobium sp. BK284]MBB3484912.1 GntP family gluconate:H+ symporter [Rhizobium sp. BK347]